MMTCSVCNKPIICGCMTNGFGDFYIHEECFESFMDKRYGKHKWMEVEDDGAGGYYMASLEGKPCGTGICYTEYTEEEIRED